jgi:choline dehydrogenase-like flavoprotein
VSTPKENIDVCIIGSGAGGGVVAKELGKNGFSVVLLEAGRRFDPLRDYHAPVRPDMEVVRRTNKGQWTVPALQTITFVERNKRRFHRPTEAHAVGGSTVRYLAYAVRMLPNDFRTYSVDGVGADWPLSYDDLVPYYRKVELELGVSGLAGDPWTPNVDPYVNPPFPNSFANTIMQRGCDKLGIKLWPTAMARLSKPFDGRPSCVQCGRCDDGCMTRAKSSTDVTYVEKAEATGRVTLLTGAVAAYINVDRAGKPTGVVYYDKNGVVHEQKARIVVVSGGSIQSPRLLLNSTSNAYPDGLANSSGLVGKYFMQHIGWHGTGVFKDRIDSYRGFYGGASSADFAETDKNHTFARGWLLEFHSGLTNPIQCAMKSGGLWGAALKDHMRSTFGHLAGVASSGEQLPDVRNAIGVDQSVKDQYGMPVAHIDFQLFENDEQLMAASKKNILSIFDAAGATKIHSMNFGFGVAPHNMGTCRMGDDPKMSVLNSFCQSHDIPNLFVIDASCFVTGGTANPSLTIHAIAERASQYIIEEARKMNL